MRPQRNAAENVGGLSGGAGEVTCFNEAQRNAAENALESILREEKDSCFNEAAA